MTFSRSIGAAALALALTGAALAQETGTQAPAKTDTASTAAAATSTSAAEDKDAAQQKAEESAAESAENSSQARIKVRDDFTKLLSRHPDELSRVLVLDPSLLSNEPFLARYPELAQFLTEHPEIRRNPHYYLREFSSAPQAPMHQRTALEEVVESFSIMFVVALITTALAWLVRTFIEQKRWSQLSRRQSEVHAKILDRLGSSDELLAYIKSPAGTKFLESAPIPLHSEPPKHTTPNSRALWSIQIGVIVAAVGLGLLLVSAAFKGESAQGFFAMGAIAFSVGAGFIASAVVSMSIARRLGSPADDALRQSMFDDTGTMR